MNASELFTGIFAIDPGALSRLIDGLPTIQAAAQPAARLGANMRRTGSTAIINVTGIIAPTDSALLRALGGTSLDGIRASLNAAMADASAERIVLAVDSPGGHVTGVSELADEIHAARSKKPITAYVSGMAASAGYWIASAAGAIVTADTGLLGSIGVASVIYDTKGMLERAGVVKHEIVSSQSPRKRPDLGTDAGRAQVQASIDALAAVFVGKVARNRGVTPNTVTGRFGGGGLLVGQDAVACGLADAVGSLAAALAYRHTAESVAAPYDANTLAARAAELVEVAKGEGIHMNYSEAVQLAMNEAKGAPAAAKLARFHAAGGCA